jgi:hypothetical protein
MEEQPITLATHVAVGTDTDAGGVAAAARRLRCEFPGLDATPSRWHRKANSRREWGRELAAPGVPAVCVARSQLLTPLVATAQPTLLPPGSATARHPERAGRRLLFAAPPPRAARDISQRSR